MKKNPFLVFLLLIFVFGSIFVFLLSSSAISLFGGSAVKVTSTNSILHLHLEGVIMDGKKILKPLIKYRKDKNVKAVVIEINSPGGVVGPSQEIYEEIKKVREVYKKPVVAVSTSLIASGAFYADVGADKIVVAPGTLIGSIGVIMEFLNLEKLYDWAKISRYSITTGKFKDSGSEYRQLREDERAYFQSLANSTLGQFKSAVAKGRNLKEEAVDAVADGRVFNGEQAIELGLADQLGTVEDSFDVAAELAGIKNDYEIFEPPKTRPGIIEILMGEHEEDDYSTKASGWMEKAVRAVARPELKNRMLFMMPGAW